MNYLEMYNNQTVSINDIPKLKYVEFMESNLQLLKNKPERHCVNYFGVKNENNITVYCCIADDNKHQLYISSSILASDATLSSLTAQNHNFEKFEREIHENFGIAYFDHPWLKPFRFSHNRSDKNISIADYPFYSTESEELHEVGGLFMPELLNRVTFVLFATENKYYISKYNWVTSIGVLSNYSCIKPNYWNELL
jgi:NADH:ubiquinone oxidoreductase subunit C